MDGPIDQMWGAHRPSSDCRQTDTFFGYVCSAFLFRIVCVKEAPEHFILSHHITMDAVETYPVQLQKGRLKAEDQLHLPRME